MPQPAALLDTDILSELLKQHPRVTHRAQAYLAEHERLAFSVITHMRSYAGSRPGRPGRKRALLKPYAKSPSSFR